MAITSDGYGAICQAAGFFDQFSTLGGNMWLAVMSVQLCALQYALSSLLPVFGSQGIRC